MSVAILSDDELLDLCARTVAVHGNPAHGGLSGEKIARLFRAIRIAQHAASAYAYGEALTLPALEFPTNAPGQLVLDRPDLKTLLDDLSKLVYNVVDQTGNRWLPEDRMRTLDQLRLCTATKAARFW